MSDAPKFDKTALHTNGAGQNVHRDYAAHFFRWGWAVSATTPYGIAKKSVLDIGCGTDLPLLNVGRFSSQLPASYVGVDYNRLKELAPGRAKWATLYGSTDFTSPATWQTLLENHGKFERIVSFECIEHMPPESGWALLWGAKQLLQPGGFFLLSTPVFNGKAAKNHVHEYTIPELQQYVEAAGFRIVRRFGTFANANLVPKAIAKWAEEKGFTDTSMFDLLWKEIGLYHSSEVLSNFVAPIIPDDSRNNVWVLTVD